MFIEGVLPLWKLGQSTKWTQEHDSCWYKGKTRRKETFMAEVWKDFMIKKYFNLLLVSIEMKMGIKLVINRKFQFWVNII